MSPFYRLEAEAGVTGRGAGGHRSFLGSPKDLLQSQAAEARTEPQGGGRA